MLNYVLIQENLDAIIRRTGYQPSESGLRELAAAAQAQKDGHNFPIALWFNREVNGVSQSVKVETTGMTEFHASNCGGDLREMDKQRDALVEATAFMRAIQDMPGLRVDGLPKLSEAAVAVLGRLYTEDETIRVEDCPAEAEELRSAEAVVFRAAGDSRAGTAYQYLKLTSFGVELWIRS